MVSYFYVFLVFSLILVHAQANNLQISNVSIVDQNTSQGIATIQLDMSWDNSWRDVTNYDAVWVFIKYIEDLGGEWKHATLYSSGVNPTGYVSGSGTAVDIRVPADKKGCFIERSRSGSGTVSVQNLKLVWEYAYDGIADEDLANVGLKVFGIEMVYIPQGSFYAGDKTSGSTAGQFDQGSAGGEDDPWYIESEAALYVKDVSTNGFYYNSAGNTGEDPSGTEFIISASFPKGYAPFYCAKYEITQGQYTDFLNSLTQIQAENRFPNHYGDSRHTITGTYPYYTAERPDRACNFLSWMDLSAYCDWAALRPMTELEFEKAARGRDIYPTINEFSWGTTSITAATTISGTEDGTETITNVEANCNYNNQTFSGGDGGSGPLRSGIFAANALSRQQAGSSYYGVCDLSGNLWERTVTVGNTQGRVFQGTHGDGELLTTASYEGNATNTDWPGFVSGQGVSGAEGSGFRGGSWKETVAGSMTVSDRSKAALSSASRDSDGGGRAVRTIE